MTDMLVNLYADNMTDGRPELKQKGIFIQRALALDTKSISAFIDQNFSETCPGWVDECKTSLYRHPISCFVAIKDKEIAGFACYDATAKGMVGPIGVAESYRKHGIAKALLYSCFEAMKMDGYAYAAIGWVSSENFYKKACGAIPIPGSFPGVYSRMKDHNP